MIRMRVYTGSFIAVLCIIVNSYCAYAQSAAEVFKEANSLYNEEKYEAARRQYEQCAEDGKITSAEIFYNIGNCYFREKDLGRALLNYKRAFNLHPRDKAIRANISFVRSLVQYKVNDNRNWYMRTAERFLSYVTINELEVGVLLFLFFFLMISLRRLFAHKKKGLQRLSFWCMFFFIASLGALCTKAYPLLFAQEAVIIADEAPVRSGPLSADAVAFRLSPGIEVLITAGKDSWHKIELVSGEEGWIEAENIECVTVT
ncbi:MAG: hypothetical protein KKH94_10740 [Candidatus Omnitrophica bacterium]|nr:hypothetical protein [Candidatus Omnitrophota bacterium]